MSLQSQLTRLARNVGALTADTNAIFEALRAKGVNVPANAQLSDVADMIESIDVPITSVEIGGRSYPVVRIGNQLWLAENLDWKLDGITIGASENPTTPSAWYYNNDERAHGVSGDKGGLLYNWHSIGLLSLNIPSGWRIPTTSDYETLAEEVGGTSIAGTKLKSTTLWQRNPGVDQYGFTSIPTGFKNIDGEFTSISGSNQNTNYWTSDEYSSTNGDHIRFNSATTEMIFSDSNKRRGYSLRLVKDVT